MMSNPRKFSEKIALHTQKQAAETAAFQEIMKEVMDIRPFGGGLMSPAPMVQQQILQSQQQQNQLNIGLNTFRGHGGSLPNVNQMAQAEKGLHQSRGGYHPPSSSPRSQRSSIGPVRIKPSHRETSPYASPPSASMLSSSMTSTTAGGFGSSAHSGRTMYAPNSYLSPPMDSSCRRFNSDSALNLNNTLVIPTTVPDSSEDSSNNSNDYSGTGTFPRNPAHDPINITNHVMSRSRTGGGDPTSLLEIPPVPVSLSSTGSLPDLTNFQYPPPLQNPVDPDDRSHSPYSTSPLTGSSITYSPTSSHASPQGAGNGHPQPRPSSQVQMPQSPHSPGSQTPQSYQENHHPLPLHVNTSFQFANDNMLSAYRSPQRPSPQNSPSPQFRSASPLDGQLSGPSSPSIGQSTQSPGNEYYLTQQAHALQQHFEQISVTEDDQKRGLSHLSRTWRQNSNAGGPYLYSAQLGHSNTGTNNNQHSPQHPQQPQTPQTPSSIPDIIFTDFSDPRSADHLQLEEILASEQMQAAFRDTLGQIDFDGFQMLDQPDLVQLDPQVEDSFRLDRL